MKKRLLIFFILLLTISMLCGCQAFNYKNIAFGTYYEITVKSFFPSKITKNISTRLDFLENTLSTNVSTSDISKINSSTANVAVSVSSDTFYLLKLSKQLHEETDGRFDIGIFPLVKLWKFSPDTFTGLVNQIPTEQEIAETVSYSTINNFTLDERNLTVTKKHDLALLDLGSIAKGYAVDVVSNIIDSEEFLVNIGGTIQSKGIYNIGIKSPRSPSTVAAIVLDNMSVATSGDYERFYYVDGIRYNHIIDPTTGSPYSNGYISATVVGKSATICDALSTSVLLLGTRAKTFLDTYYPAYSCLLLTENSYEIIGDNIFEVKDPSLLIK